MENMSSRDCPKYVLTGLGPYIGPYLAALCSTVGCPIFPNYGHSQGSYSVGPMEFKVPPLTYLYNPSKGELTQHLQNLPNTFRIYPTPSEFVQHLQNLPNTFRIYPPPSEFTHHLQNKTVLGPLDLFVPFFDIWFDKKNVDFDKQLILVR